MDLSFLLCPPLPPFGASMNCLDCGNELPIAPCPSHAVSYLCVLLNLFSLLGIPYPRPLPQPPPLPVHPHRFTLNSSDLSSGKPAPAGENAPVHMHVSVIASPLCKRMFCFLKSFSLIRPVAPKSGWTQKSLELQLQKL